MATITTTRLMLYLGCFGFIALANASILQALVERRGGRFVDHDPFDAAKHSRLVEQVEHRYQRTDRSVEKSQLVLKWKAEHEDHQMLDEAGRNGSWCGVIDRLWLLLTQYRYFELGVGDPVQTLEVDLDMLSHDFYSIMTSSGKGSKYDTFLSQSHEVRDEYSHALCRLSADVFHLPAAGSRQLSWPICQASHSSRHTLARSGTVLGLSPSSALSHLNALSLVQQLYSRAIISNIHWSFTALDDTRGILTIGGTLARVVEETKARAEVELESLSTLGTSASQVNDAVDARLALLGSTIDEQFKWVDVHGVAGWWTGLLTGVWINGMKVLRNQPFLLDLSSPYILAPPIAFGHLYGSIAASLVLSDPYQNFAAFPCLNPPDVAFELGGWNFRIFDRNTRLDGVLGPAGGRFSLGRIEDLGSLTGNDTKRSGNVTSGYCAGIIVGSSMGSTRAYGWQATGMKHMWVLGEPFFRGMGIVFDEGVNADGEKRKARIGFRLY